MNHEEFNEIAKNRLDTCTEILIPKGLEYSRNGDRLHNFKTAGRIAGTTPERALLGMYLKHLVSIMDIIVDVEAGNIPTKEILSEKITDSINYHLLLEALILERISE